nr:hypothetical protein CFP56_36487 [Quercus suber]
MKDNQPGSKGGAPQSKQKSGTGMGVILNSKADIANARDDSVVGLDAAFALAAHQGAIFDMTLPSRWNTTGLPQCCTHGGVQS